MKALLKHCILGGLPFLIVLFFSLNSFAEQLEIKGNKEVTYNSPNHITLGCPESDNHCITAFKGSDGGWYFQHDNIWWQIQGITQTGNDEEDAERLAEILHTSQVECILIE